MQPTQTGNDNLVLIPGSPAGHTVIPTGTGLTRLNYFDGQFLTAEQLKLEQNYHRTLARCSNRAGGWGVVNGLSCVTSCDGKLQIEPGHAIDAAGNCLILSESIQVDLDELIQKSQPEFVHKPAFGGEPGQSAGFDDCHVLKADVPGEVLQPSNLYVITMGPAEAACGQAEVFGNPCEHACETESEYAHIVEGIVVRAVPLSQVLNLKTFPGHSAVHLRSRVTSAFFAAEQAEIASLISGTNLLSPTWCLGAEAAGADGVPLALVARGSNSFLDMWSVRRERIELPPRHYWAHRMMMRPWRVFLAQVLQFQCQLRDAFPVGVPEGGTEGPCKEAYGLLGIVQEELDAIHKLLGEISAEFTAKDLEAGTPDKITAQQKKVQNVSKSIQDSSTAFFNSPNDRILIQHGIVEVPPAGYLPVIVESIASVNQQIKSMLGPGVDLKFCSVRPDFVAHALEEAQHMERICLVSGLDDPAKRPQVDVLVPDGELVEIAGKGIAFEATLDMEILGGTNLGAARLETLPTGGGNFHLAGHALKPGGPQITVGEAVVARSFPIDGVSGSELDEVAEGEATAVESDESVESVAQPAEDFVVEIDGGTTFDGGEIEPLQLKSSWLTINWGRDPFSMDNGEKTYVSLDWWVGAAGGMAVAKRSRLHGNITISKPHVEASLVNATLTGSFDQSNYSDGNATSSTAAATFDFSLKRSTNAGQESLSLGVFVGQQLIVFEATWSNSPRQVQLKMDLQGKGGAGKYLKLLLSGILAESTDVLSAGNSYHNAAVTGLEMIGGAIQDPAFALTRQSLLFPPAAKTVTELRATRDWVLFHRRRQRTCDKVETPEVEQLTHIVATSWQHSGTESEFLPIEQPGVNDPLGIGIVIGFDSPVKLIDPTDSSIFQVSADINMAKLQQLGGQFTLVELLQVVPLIRSLQSCRCLHGNIVPVNWEAVPDQPGRISRAIATSAPARGLAFMFDPQDIGLAQTRQAGARYDIKLRCDFILDQKNNPIDGEFLRAQFPTGNSHPGGIFESWFDVSPIAGKDRQEVYLTKGIHSEDAVSALQGSIEKAGFSFNANTMDRLGEVTFDESNADVSGLDGVESAYKSAFPNLPTGVGITTLSVLRKGLDANTHSRFHSQAERIRDRIATGDPVIQVVSGENAGIREGDSALSILIAVRGIE